jgi:hypothetical protein
MVFEIIKGAGFLTWAEMKDDLPVFFPVMFECLAGKVLQIKTDRMVW